MEAKMIRFREILDKSSYTVALCGSGMTEEAGVLGMKNPDKAYDIEIKYGYSVEEIFSSSFYNTRPEKFFEFYKNEILKNLPEATESGGVLAAMERAGKLNCIITENIFQMKEQAGCKNVINLHGSIYNNQCPRCKKKYSMEEVRDAKKVLLCSRCGIPVRPQVSLYGEMVDSQLMTRTSNEISKAQVLMLLGTSLDSEVFGSYANHFQGESLIIIHPQRKNQDGKADLLFLDYPMNILPKLGY